MSVLVDTGVLYADHDTDAARHEAASAALAAVYDGELGQPYVSDYVYDEAVTLTHSRAGRIEPAIRLGERLRGVDPYPAAYELLRVSAAAFDDAVGIFDRYADQGLSFTDATTIALAERHAVDGLLTFDSDFEGLVPRFDPDEWSGVCERWGGRQWAVGVNDSSGWLLVRDAFVAWWLTGEISKLVEASAQSIDRVRNRETRLWRETELVLGTQIQR